LEWGRGRGCSACHVNQIWKGAAYHGRRSRLPWKGPAYHGRSALVGLSPPSLAVWKEIRGPHPLPTGVDVEAAVTTGEVGATITAGLREQDRRGGDLGRGHGGASRSRTQPHAHIGRRSAILGEGTGMRGGRSATISGAEARAPWHRGRGAAGFTPGEKEGARPSRRHGEGARGRGHQGRGAAGITPRGGRGGAAIAASGTGGADTRLGLGRERGGSATAEPCAMQPVDAYDTNIISSRDLWTNVLCLSAGNRKNPIENVLARAAKNLLSLGAPDCPVVHRTVSGGAGWLERRGRSREFTGDVRL
jgi:hypothetical protein